MRTRTPPPPTHVWKARKHKSLNLYLAYIVATLCGALAGAPFVSGFWLWYFKDDWFVYDTYRVVAKLLIVLGKLPVP